MKNTLPFYAPQSPPPWSPCVLSTRERGRGILQILGQSNDALGVPIRYKLVSPDITEPQPESSKPGQHSAAQPTAQSHGDKV